MDKGIDPRKQKREHARTAKILSEVFEAFMETRQLRPRTAGDYRRYFNSYLGGVWEQRARKKTDKERQKAKVHQSWHGVPITHIDAGMVAQRHLAIARSSAGQSQANACMRMLRAVFTWARADLGKAVLPENPVTTLTEKRQWFGERARQSYIRREELAPWFAAAIALGNDNATRDRAVMSVFLRFVLLTGARRGEAEKLTWSDVNFVGKAITFRDTKNGGDRTVPMTRYVEALLRELRPGDAGESLPSTGYVFAASSGKTGHIQEPRKALASIAKVSGVRQTVHDLRRTYATHLESLDVSIYAIKRLLGHSDGRDVTARHYAVFDTERLRGAAQRAEDHILSLAGSGVTAQVVPLPVARAA